MKKLFFFFLLVGSLMSASAQEAKLHGNTQVSICNNKTSKVYHVGDCSALKRCTSEIAKMRVTEATTKGYTACKLCVNAKAVTNKVQDEKADAKKVAADKKVDASKSADEKKVDATKKAADVKVDASKKVDDKKVDAKKVDATAKTADVKADASKKVDDKKVDATKKVEKKVEVAKDTKKKVEAKTN